MKQARAFSDTEIVTIATVAASALGGIVIGLGRGQESGPPARTGESRIPASVTQAIETGAKRVPPLPARSASVDLHGVRRKYDDLRPTKRKLGKRLAMQYLVRPALASAKARFQLKSQAREPSLVDKLAALRESIMDAPLSGAPNVDLEALKSEILSGLARFGPDGSDPGEATHADRDGVVARLTGDLDAIESGVAQAPDVLRAASSRTRNVVQKRVAAPVAGAASSTGDATKDALAALAWLSAGAAIVYFGLLSDERREQVKSGLCGAVEQTRLLMLDLQGYEPEM